MQDRSGAELDSSPMGSGGGRRGATAAPGGGAGIRLKRRKWLALGFNSGDPSKSDTFAANAP